MIRVVLEHRARNAEDAKKLVEVIRETRAVAKKQPGFIQGETLVDVDDPCHVLVNSTWRNPSDWKAWDESKVRIDMKWMIEELLDEPYTASVQKADVIWQESIQHVF
jgi:heme oxygenase (mycobilin-producing)